MPKEFQENISTGENKKETLPAQLDISNENKEKVPENLQSYGGFFKIKIPNERQGAIEYDLEEICRLQGCTIEDVLRINHLTIAQLKPGKIVIIPITLWDKNDKEIEHKIEPGLHEIEWSNETPSEEAQRMAQWIATNHVTDTSLIFDKKTARMYIIKNGKMMYSTIFLSGKNNKTDIMNFPGMTEDFSEETKSEFMITPAGKFPITMNESTEDYALSFDYLSGVFADGALHAPTEKSRKMNLQKLKTPSIDDNNTSWGCMVMTPEALEAIKKFYQSNKTFAYVIPLHGDLEEFISLY